MVDSIPLPDLRVVSTKRIIPHEQLDSGRSKPLAQRIRQDGFLANPLLVTAHRDDYILLDGTNRLNALRHMQMPGALVQLVDYSSNHIELYTWHHVLTEVSEAELVEQIRSLTGIILTDTKPADSVIATLVCSSGRTRWLTSGKLSLHQRVSMLSRVVANNIEQYRLYRAVHMDIQALEQAYPGFSALMAFTPFLKEEVIQIATGPHQAPAGVTRHVVQGRALRLNYRLDDLSDENIEASNQRLQEWLQQRYAARGIRFYSESAYLFDE